MNKSVIIISVMILLVLTIFLLYNKSNQLSPNNIKNAETISQKSITLSEEIKSMNGQIIDVREPEEYKESHADNATNIPLGEILGGDFSKIDSTRPIYLYCRSGARADRAKTALEQSGYKNVTNLGGLNDWIVKQGKTCNTSNSSC